eukprot:13091_1
MEKCTYQQGQKHINSTILYKLVNELGLDEVLNQYVKITDTKPIDQLMSQVQMYPWRVADKDKFWNQLGFEIKNEHSELISMIAKHSSLLETCMHTQDDYQINSTVLGI